MDFKTSKTIFMQIADVICERIIKGELPTSERIPSVREMAAETGVNPNTIMRTYTELQNKKILRNQRGIGFFVEDDAEDKIIAQHKEEFFAHDLPDFMKKLSLLRLKKDEINSIINQLKTI